MTCKLNLTNSNPFIALPEQSGERKGIIVRAGEITSLAQHIIWSVKHWSEKESSGYEKNVSIELETMSTTWSIAAQCNNYLKEANGQANSANLTETMILPDRANNAILRFISDLISKLLINLGIRKASEQEKFIDKLKKKLKGGYCFGISTELLNLLMDPSSKNLSQKSLMKKVNKTRVGLFQTLNNLKASLIEVQQYRKAYLQGMRINPGDEATFPEEIKRERANGTLEEKYNEGKELEKKFDQAILDLANFSSSQKEEYTVAKESKETDINKVKTFLNASDKQFLVKLFPDDPNQVGHALVLDLQNNILFDENAGLYHFLSKEGCITAFLERIAAYPELQTGTWEFESFNR